MSKIIYVILMAVTSILFWGCASTQDLTKGGRFGDRSMFAKGEIKMPANYNKENFRKLLMGVVVSNVKIDPTSKKQFASGNPAQGLSTRLQTEMAKLKRFSILSAFNRGGVTFFKSLEDVGDANMSGEVNMRQMDLVLTLNLMLSLERHERATDDLLIFEVEVDANCEDLKTREVKFAEKAKGQVRRAVKISLTGMKMGGYDQSDVRQAFLEASMKAISSIVNKLGNYYPVGGRITGLLGNRMTLNRGFEQGIGKDMQMVVYAPINGVDIPLAVAEASPADNTANLVAWRWNMEDPYAKRIIAQMKEDFDWLQKHECYAVSLRLAVPPEWDREEDNLDRGTR